MKKDFNVIIERDMEGYLVASFPALPGCHTQAKSLDILMERIREAIELYLEVQQNELEELGELRKWFREQEWSEWDRQIERDSDSGKLKTLTEMVLADHAAGRTSPI